MPLSMQQFGVGGVASRWVRPILPCHDSATVPAESRSQVALPTDYFIGGAAVFTPLVVNSLSNGYGVHTRRFAAGPPCQRSSGWPSITCSAGGTPSGAERGTTGGDARAASRGAPPHAMWQRHVAEMQATLGERFSDLPMVLREGIIRHVVETYVGYGPSCMSSRLIVTLTSWRKHMGRLDHLLIAAVPGDGEVRRRLRDRLVDRCVGEALGASQWFDHWLARAVDEETGTTVGSAWFRENATETAVRQLRGDFPDLPEVVIRRVLAQVWGRASTGALSKPIGLAREELRRLWERRRATIEEMFTRCFPALAEEARRTVVDAGLLHLCRKGTTICRLWPVITEAIASLGLDSRPVRDHWTVGQRRVGIVLPADAVRIDDLVSLLQKQFPQVPSNLIHHVVTRVLDTAAFRRRPGQLTSMVRNYMQGVARRLVELERCVAEAWPDATMVEREDHRDRAIAHLLETLPQWERWSDARLRGVVAVLRQPEGGPPEVSALDLDLESLSGQFPLLPRTLIAAVLARCRTYPVARRRPAVATSAAKQCLQPASRNLEAVAASLAAIVPPATAHHEKVLARVVAWMQEHFRLRAAGTHRGKEFCTVRRLEVEAAQALAALERETGTLPSSVTVAIRALDLALRLRMAFVTRTLTAELPVLDTTVVEAIVAKTASLSFIQHHHNFLLPFTRSACLARATEAGGIA